MEALQDYLQDLYASRSRMETLIIERAKFGGQATTTDELENYPGSIEDCTGTSLSKRMRTASRRIWNRIC